MNAMKTTGPPKGVVAILGANDPDSKDICRMIAEGHFQAIVCEDLNELETILAGCCMAAILDIDSVPLDNRTIRSLTLAYPGTCFFCSSRERFHPDLQDAICYHLFASLHKPVDPDELQYFLNCILEEGSESRGPPKVRG